MVLAAYDSSVGALREPGRLCDRFDQRDVMEDIAPHNSLAAAAADVHRAAFNAAFRQLSLKWHWDPDTYRDLMRLPAGKDRIRTYLRARQQALLDSYDPEFLVDAIHAAKTRCYSIMTVICDTEPHDVERREAGVSGVRL